MRGPKLIKRIFLALIASTVLAGTLGQGCPDAFPGPRPGPIPGPGPIDPPVTVELINITNDPVDALLWADPGTVPVPEDVSIPVNFIDIGGLLLPGDVATVELECFDAGTLLADGDLLLPSGDAVLSDNLILLLEREDFFCGDLVSFYYEVDVGGIFFISADVNDVTIAP